MGDAENALPSSKKRAASSEISRDNPGLDDDGSIEQETGTFKKASDEVLARRKIVKVRRSQTTSTPSSNPFAGIRLVPLTEPIATPAVATIEVASARQQVSEEGQSDTCEEVEKGKGEKSELSESEIMPGKTDELVAETAVDKVSVEDMGEAVDKPVTEISEDEEKSKESEGKNDEPVAETAVDKVSVEDKGKAVDKPVTEIPKDEEKSKESEGKTDEPVAENAIEKESSEDKGINSAVNEATELKVDNEKPAKDETEKENAGGDDTENQDKKDNGNEIVYPSAEGAPLNSFQQLSSSQNAFTGLAGTGFSTSTFTFGSVPKDGSVLGSGSGSLFGQKNEQPSFGFGLSNNGSSSLSSIVSKTEGSGFPSMQEVPVETGEENERVVFSADSVLFEFLDGGWKERGKGEVKVNVSAFGAERARLLMRARGHFRLILNASLYPDMKLANMDKRGITFACMNSIGEGKDSLSTFALKFKDGSIVEEFCAAVAAHKDKAPAAMKTPENSPKASSDE
ncbi:PREDICTED: nuclear pore complex protein NUP50B-like [Populus euphratica]|uniref:Nuclear pore complex protein NUP50B-like n=1 Tax=Populus euphratica TaxID=75702 RepID=A0AAJ6SXE7_POPEU|nr:PREDICTED: nuclear pore complex protein NUP50B-like [Populus euphratica]